MDGSPIAWASETLAELESQHAALREMMDRCEELADDLDAGRSGPLRLTREVARLRLAFDAHNKFEEQELKPALVACGAFGAAQAAQAVAAHISEHRSMSVQLGSQATRDLREVIANLRAHLAAEDQYFAVAWKHEAD